MLTTAAAAFVTALAGLVAVLLWRAGGRLIGALVELARLPDAVDGIDSTGAELVTELRGVIHELRSVARRVDRLEAYLPDQLRVRADVTLSNPENQELPR